MWSETQVSQILDQEKNRKYFNEENNIMKRESFYFLIYHCNEEILIPLKSSKRAFMQTNEKPVKIMFGNPQHSADQYQIPFICTV